MADDRREGERRDAMRLDQPRDHAGPRLRLPSLDPEVFGGLAEKFARRMGTAQFLIYMTVFVTVWLAWNTFMPAAAQFDPRELNYTLLTLILSLQASYAAPLILLAQNRQDDRDRVALEQDRARDERNLADTEYLTREVAALRIALRDMATRDYLRSELRDVVEELAADRAHHCPQCGHGQPDRAPHKAKKKSAKSGKQRPEPSAPRKAEADPVADQARALLAGERREADAPGEPTAHAGPGDTAGPAQGGAEGPPPGR